MMKYAWACLAGSISKSVINPDDIQFIESIVPCSLNRSQLCSQEETKHGMIEICNSLEQVVAYSNHNMRLRGCGLSDNIQAVKYADFFKSVFVPNYLPEYQNKSFVHIRMGDIEEMSCNLSYDYYSSALSKLSGEILCGTDNASSPTVLKLKERFNLKLVNAGPSDTMRIAYSCKDIVLSDGTFSWWIGMLSNARLYFPSMKYRQNKIWCGPIDKALEYTEIE
jgi:hypothetical protein